MREIKFRAWDKDRLKMVMLRMIELIPDNIKRPVVAVAGEHSGIEPADDYEIMQFTGLKDKNGKEIYGGDLGRLHCHEECNGVLGEVGWFNDGWWIFTNKHHKGEIGEFKLRTSEVVQSIDQTGEYSAFEIIGNIYENPELLK